MITTDYHPLSVAEDIGFNQVLRPRHNCPRRNYFTECVISEICGGMIKEVSKLLSSDEPVVNLTTDIWICSSNYTSLLRLTAQFLIDKSFAKVSAVLHT